MLRFFQSLLRHPVRYSVTFPRRFCDVKSIHTVQFDLLKEKLLAKRLLLIDVREPKELKEEGKILNSVNIPLGEITHAFEMNDSSFQEKYGISKPSFASDLVLMCRAGKRAIGAYEILKKLGYNNMTVYSGSFLDWIEKGGPLEK